MLAFVRAVVRACVRESGLAPNSTLESHNDRCIAEQSQCIHERSTKCPRRATAGDQFAPRCGGGCGLRSSNAHSEARLQRVPLPHLSASGRTAGDVPGG